MSTLFINGKVLRSTDTKEGKGYIAELDDKENEITILQEYKNYEEAEDALIAMGLSVLTPGSPH